MEMNYFSSTVSSNGLAPLATTGVDIPFPHPSFQKEISLLSMRAIIKKFSLLSAIGVQYITMCNILLTGEWILPHIEIINKKII